MLWKSVRILWLWRITRSRYMLQDIVWRHKVFNALTHTYIIISHIVGKPLHNRASAHTPPPLALLRPRYCPREQCLEPWIRSRRESQSAAACRHLSLTVLVQPIVGGRLSPEIDLLTPCKIEPPFLGLSDCVNIAKLLSRKGDVCLKPSSLCVVVERGGEVQSCGGRGK